MKTYNFLYALYVGRAEEAVHYLSRLETDYQLTSQIQSQRVLIQPVSANPYPSRPAFVPALLDMSKRSVRTERCVINFLEPLLLSVVDLELFKFIILFSFPVLIYFVLH